jgi:hypothetical protein
VQTGAAYTVAHSDSAKKAEKRTELEKRDMTEMSPD